MDPWKDLGLNKLRRPSEHDLRMALTTLRASVDAMSRAMGPSSRTTFDPKLIHFQVLEGYITAKSSRTIPKTLSVNVGPHGIGAIEQILSDHQKDQARWGKTSLTPEDRRKIEQAKQNIIHGSEKHAPANAKVNRLSRLREDLHHIQVKWKASGGKGLWFPDAGRSNQ